MVDQNVRVDDKRDGKGDDVIDEDKVDYVFEDFVKHFQVGVQENKTSYRTHQSNDWTSES